MIEKRMTGERTMSQEDHNRVKAFPSATIESYEDGCSEELQEMLLESYVSGMQNVAELAKSNCSADIAKVKILTELLKLKKNNGTITKEEAIFFRCLLAVVKLEKSINGAPVWQILKEDLLNPKIAEIKEWARKLITKRKAV